MEIIRVVQVTAEALQVGKITEEEKIHQEKQ